MKNLLIQYSTVASRNMDPFKWQAAGMGYAIRSADDRFIVVDGGHPADAEPLIETLKAHTEREIPEVDLWIITHPHGDHFGAAAQANESFYYFDGRNFIKQSCDFSEQVELGAPDLGESHAVIVTQLGYGRDRVFYSVYDFMTQTTTVRTLKDDGHRRTVAENCLGAALLSDGPLAELYTIEADENGVREIVRYSLDMLGLSDIRTVVVREGETLAVSEHITGLYSEMRDVYFTTEFGENTGHTRAYLIHEHSTELVDEDGAPEQADEITDIHAENTD
jgi:hypothetical protein